MPLAILFHSMITIYPFWMFVILFHIPCSSSGEVLLDAGNFTEPVSSCSEEMASQVLINLTSTLRYNPRIRPNYGGKPVEVNISYTVLGFRDIQEVDMTYVIDMYFRQQWVDERLRHSLNCTLTFLTGIKHPADFIWVADTSFENAVTSYMHNVVTNNHMVIIYSDGTVKWSTRITAKAFCPMKLSFYPFDSQICPLTLVSYNYMVNDVRYAWQRNYGVSVLDKELSQYIVTDIKTNEKDVTYSIGVYSTLNAYFTFKRRLGYYVIQVFTPSMFLVVLAGFSFWMDPRATPARVALSLTTLLTTATIWSSINSNMPKVNYVKAIDIYFLTSFSFVFSTLLQYMFLLTLKANMSQRRVHREQDKEGHSMKAVKQRASISTPTSTSTGEFFVYDIKSNYSDQTLARKYGLNNNDDDKSRVFDPETMSCIKRDEEELKCILWLDRGSRLVYPLSYLIFNLLYWFKYY